MNSYFLCIKSCISYGQMHSCSPLNLYQQLRSTSDVCTLGSVPPCLQPLDSLLILFWFDLFPLISLVVWLNEREWDVHRTKTIPSCYTSVCQIFFPRPGCVYHYLRSGAFSSDILLRDVQPVHKAELRLNHQAHSGLELSVLVLLSAMPSAELRPLSFPGFPDTFLAVFNVFCW